jgi:molecular chaperone GrpE
VVAEEDALTVARRERDEYLDMVRRVQADFENYKKRMLRQQTDQLERASEHLVAKLLPALDAFALTRAHMGDEDDASPDVKALFQAAGLVDDALAKEGLERIDDAGASFDPTMHDAVEHAPAADEVAPGTGSAGPVVAEVLRPGYRWKGRVIRPAMVRVRG